MKIRHSTESGNDKIELQMTPMIDIVFQLLVFFIMTFKVVSQEGDFNIKMPMAAPSEGAPEEDSVPPIKVRIRANAEGERIGIAINGDPVGDWNELRDRIIAVVGDQGGASEESDAEVELDCDYNLKYENVIEAITSVSGYIEDGEIIHLVEKIKFAKQRDE